MANVKLNPVHFLCTVLLVIQLQSALKPSDELKTQQYKTQLRNKHNNNILFTERKCGFVDRNLFINNGTYLNLRFYSREKFSLVVEQDLTAAVFTAFLFGKQIGIEQLQLRKASGQKVFFIQNAQEQASNSTQKGREVQQKKIYYGSLAIYAMCKTVAISSSSTDLQIQVTFFPNEEQNQSIQLEGERSQEYADGKTQLLKIPTTVYCIAQSSIMQANFFAGKLQYLLLVSFYGLLIYFKPFKNIPLIFRIAIVVGYVGGGFYAQDWYTALLITYGGIFFLIFTFKIFQQRTYRYFLMESRHFILTKTCVLVSLACAFPLGIKSHLNNPDIEPKKFMLYLINIVMMCNNLVLISSTINFTRFRHVFYYFLVFAIVQHYFGHVFEKNLTFNIILPQMFPTPFQCESFFFMVWLMPVCNFFFESYSEVKLAKFLILLFPAIIKPIGISYTSSFLVGFIIWITNEGLSGRDLVKIIRYKR